MRRWMLLLGGLALLCGLSGSGGLAAEREADRPGAFDFYLMSFTVAPAFCALAPRNAEKQECRDGADAAYRETPLAIHGLWPNRERVSVNLQPQFCSEQRIGRLSPGLREALQRYMPAVSDGLDRYEWRRHGTCSGLEPEAYFAAEVRLAEQANATIGAVLRDGALFGREVKVDDLIAAVAAKDPAIGAAMVVSCRFPRGEPEETRRALISEIRLVLDKSLAPIPAERVGIGQNSGCPGRAGFLPAGYSRS